MNDLRKYFEQNDHRLIHKWDHYFEIYDRHFSRFRNQEITLLEIGVSHGGSLQMWKKYFGPQAKIIGVDIDPRCQTFEEEQIKIFIGSQEDKTFLEKLKAEIPKVDILIDDGGHTMNQQIVTFESMYEHIKENGVYLCEDLHTSYWPEYGGGVERSGTFIEYSKKFIDYLNAWHSQETAQLSINEFTKSTHSLHFYDSVLVIEKRKLSTPFHLMTGHPSW